MIFRDLPRALMIGIPLVTIVYLLTNIAYIAVVGGHGILNSGAVAMVSITHNNAQETCCSFWKNACSSFVGLEVKTRQFSRKEKKFFVS